MLVREIKKSTFYFNSNGKNQLIMEMKLITVFIFDEVEEDVNKDSRI
ncbi:hypothetical protein ACQKND_12050 [Viridibacillus arvi]